MLKYIYLIYSRDYNTVMCKPGSWSTPGTGVYHNIRNKHVTRADAEQEFHNLSFDSRHYGVRKFKTCVIQVWTRDYESNTWAIWNSDAMLYRGADGNLAFLEDDLMIFDSCEEAEPICRSKERPVRVKRVGKISLRRAE